MTLNEEFDELWEKEIARNGGIDIGADYRHWMRKGFMEAKRTLLGCTAETPRMAEAAEWRDWETYSRLAEEQLTAGVPEGSELCRYCHGKGHHLEENSPVGTNAIGMLEFLADRMEYAGVGELVAKSYARNIRLILNCTHQHDWKFFGNWRGETDIFYCEGCKSFRS
jgi:hypothetical protein